MEQVIPGKVVERFKRNGLRMARVQYGNAVHEACLEYHPETEVGDYVLVHVEFVTHRLDTAEAERILAALAELDDLPLPITVAEPGAAQTHGCAN
jgi:hydrogenase expression/formation protein HypC